MIILHVELEGDVLVECYYVLRGAFSTWVSISGSKGVLAQAQSPCFSTIHASSIYSDISSGCKNFFCLY